MKKKNSNQSRRVGARWRSGFLLAFTEWLVNRADWGGRTFITFSPFPKGKKRKIKIVFNFNYKFTNTCVLQRVCLSIWKEHCRNTVGTEFRFLCRLLPDWEQDQFAVEPTPQYHDFRTKVTFKSLLKVTVLLKKVFSFTLLKNWDASGTWLVRGTTLSHSISSVTQISKPPAFFSSGNLL